MRPRVATRQSSRCPSPSVPSWTDQAIAKGWGYGSIVPASIQPEATANSTTGIIGLDVNKGKAANTGSVGGALRAWQWGVSRLIDYFEANEDSKVNAKKGRY